LTSSSSFSGSSLSLLRGERGEECLEVFVFVFALGVDDNDDDVVIVVFGGLRTVVAFSVRINLSSFPLDVGTRTSSLTASFFDLKSPSAVAAAVEERVTLVDGIELKSDSMDASLDDPFKAVIAICNVYQHKEWFTC